MATLYDLAMRYLQQGLPSISGIFPATIPPIGGTPPPTTPDPTPPGQSQGIVNAGGGDNFSVYNPDPNRTRTGDDYSPFAFNRVMRNTEKFGETVGPNPDLFYPRPTKFSQLMDKIPSSLNFFKGIESLLPVNNRAILENELLGQGFQIDDIGRIVTDDYNTPEGIMAGYNASRMTRQTFDKRIDTINETIAKKKAKGEDTSVLENRIDLIEQAKDKFLGGSGKATTVFNEALKQKDIDKGFINDQGVTYDEEKDIIEQIIESKKTGKPVPGITTGPFPGLTFQPGMGFGVSPLGEFDTGSGGITTITRAGRDDVDRGPPSGGSGTGFKAPTDPSGGQSPRGSRIPGGLSSSGFKAPSKPGQSPRGSRTGRDNAMDRSRGGGQSRNTSATRSDLGNLGFSDIRLKENVELIGKSPSNINIYKFNYKDNPTTYQGVMAHEVPWANVKHDNGYMMVDYNKVDVEFKQWQK